LIQYHGYKDGKHQVFETEPGVMLNFHGPDSGQFAQVNVPKTVTRVVQFKLTANEFLDLIHQSPVEAESWKVQECAEGHTVVTLLDHSNRAFAEAHIGDAEDVDRLILALLADGCCACIVERLEKLIAKVRSDLALAGAQVSNAEVPRVYTM
jgi:hypothetical protein